MCNMLFLHVTTAPTLWFQSKSYAKKVVSFFRCLYGKMILHYCLYVIRSLLALLRHSTLEGIFRISTRFAIQLPPNLKTRRTRLQLSSSVQVNGKIKQLKIYPTVGRRLDCLLGIFFAPSHLDPSPSHSSPYLVSVLFSPYLLSASLYPRLSRPIPLSRLQCAITPWHLVFQSSERQITKK